MLSEADRKFLSEVQRRELVGLVIENRSKGGFKHLPPRAISVFVAMTVLARLQDDGRFICEGNPDPIAAASGVQPSCVFEAFEWLWKAGIVRQIHRATGINDYEVVVLPAEHLAVQDGFQVAKGGA